MAPLHFRVDLHNLSCDSLAVHFHEILINFLRVRFLAPYFRGCQLCILSIPLAGYTNTVAGLLGEFDFHVVVAVAKEPERGDVHALHWERLLAIHLGECLFHIGTEQKVHSVVNETGAGYTCDVAA